MIDINKFTDRLWYLYFINEGIFFFSFNSDPKDSFHSVLPRYNERYACKDITDMESGLIPAKVWYNLNGNSSQKAEDLIFQHCHGVVFSEHSDLLKILSEWNYYSIKKSKFPLLVFSRDTLNSVKLNCVVSSMCVDANFLQTELPNSEYMYRNQATLINTLGVPAPVMPSGLIKLWNNWIAARNIFAYSKKYYCAEFYGYPSKLNLLRGKNLYKTPQDEDMVKYLLFYTLGMNKFEIEKLQDIGFVWNRYNQVWVGADGSVDEGELRSFIAQDNMATPDNLGFVPEWYASIDLARYSSSRERGGNRFDNSVLWKQFCA